MVLPTALDILVNRAMAQTCDPATLQASMPALFTIDARGGACFAWDIPPRDGGGNFLQSYSRLGLPNADSTATDRGFLDTPFKGGVKRSPDGSLIPRLVAEIDRLAGGNPADAATAVLGNTVAFPIWSVSRDDSSTVGNDIQNAAVQAGLYGKLKVLGERSSSTGISNVDAFNLATATPFVPNNVDDVINTLGAPSSTSALNLSDAKKDKLMNIIKQLDSSQAQRLARAPAASKVGQDLAAIADVNKCVLTGGQVGDPVGSGIETVWELGVNGTPASNSVRAAMTLAALEGNSGPVGFEMGGYDYHGRAQNANNGQIARHQQLADLLAKVLLSAHRMNKPAFVWLVTDGATDTQPGEVDPRGDSGENGGNIVFVYQPNGSGNAGFGLKNGIFQIGAFEERNGNQAVARNSVTESIQQGALSALVNYLHFAGKLSELSKALGTFDPGNYTQLIALK